MIRRQFFSAGKQGRFMAVSRVLAGFLACCCLASSSGAQSSKKAVAASFRSDVAAFMAVALREAPSDFSNIPSQRVQGAKDESVEPFGHSLKECWRGERPRIFGMPKVLLCKSKAFAQPEVAARREEAEAAIDAAVPKSWKRSAEEKATEWSEDNEFLDMILEEPEATTHARSITIVLFIPQHVRYSPLGPSVAHFLDVGMGAVPDNFKRLRGNTEDGMFYDVNADFGEGLPSCREYLGSLECFSPGFLDPEDVQMKAAKAAVIAALPANFSAGQCGYNTGEMPVCSWTGPKDVKVVLIVQPEHSLHYVSLSIEIPSPPTQ